MTWIIYIHIGSHFLDRCFIGSGEEDILRVFTIYGHGGHLGHVTWIIYIHIGSHFLDRCFIRNLALIGQVVSEKKIFEKYVWMTDRPRSRDDLDLN